MSLNFRSLRLFSPYGSRRCNLFCTLENTRNLVSVNEPIGKPTMVCEAGSPAGRQQIFHSSLVPIWLPHCELAINWPLCCMKIARFVVFNTEIKASVQHLCSIDNRVALRTHITGDRHRRNDVVSQSSVPICFYRQLTIKNEASRPTSAWLDVSQCKLGLLRDNKVAPWLKLSELPNTPYNPLLTTPAEG